MKKTLLAALIAASPLCLFAQLPSYLPTDGLVGWWPFNGNANDESGNGNDGTVNGATLAFDRFGSNDSAYDFDGINDNIGVSHNQNLDFNNGFTLNFWLRINELGPNNQWFVDKSFDPSSYHWGIGMDGNGQLSTVFSTTNGNFDTGGSSNQFLSVNQWQMLTMSYDGSILKIFSGPEIIWSIIASGDMINNTLPIKFGNFPHQNMPPYGYHYNGQLDDIAIYNRALTQQEITALFTGVPTDNNNGNTANTTAPAAIAYQAVARNAQGQPLSEAYIQVKFTLLADSLTAAAEYSESHALTTNALGLFTTAFGAGTPLSGTFAAINWAAGNKFLKVELDAGSGFVDMGTQQLLSVPYSMRSNSSAKAGTIENAGLPVYADNAAALAGGLVAGQMYRTATGDLKIVY